MALDCCDRGLMAYVPTPLLAGAERLEVQLCLFKRRMVRAAAERRCELELQGVVLPKAEWANVVAPGGLLEDKETAAWARIAAATRFHGPPPGTCRRNFEETAFAGHDPAAQRCPV